MAAPQMTQNTLDALRGFPSRLAVTHTAKVSSTVEFPVKPGRVCHLANDGTYVVGLPAVSGAGTGPTKIYQPIFIFSGSNDVDVANDGGITGAGLGTDDPIGWVPAIPSGYVMGFVATGAYELESTEFDKTVTYEVNDALTAPVGPLLANEATGGVLTKGTPYTNPICGIVSRPHVPSSGERLNHNKRVVLSFWPYVLPPTRA